MSAVRIELPGAGPTAYDIHVEPGVLDRLGPIAGRLAKAPSAAVISDSNVGPLYGQRAVRSLTEAGLAARLVTFPAGEQHKHLATVCRLWDELAGMRVERASPLVALGGGVVGDVAGFVAACYLRGMPVFQVPTTLLACVDSSVGGKTGVDHPQAGKNMIGAFHQPLAVLIDPLLLATLPPREWSCGLAESIKHGVIRDADFLAWLEDNADGLLELAENSERLVPAQAACLIELIERNCRIKAAVVSADEKESGLRAILNFGHTVGHAVEALGGFSRLLHGEAVSIGMVVETRIAVARGLASPALLDRLAGLLARLRLPTAVPGEVSVGDLLALAGKDKKVRAGRMRFVLPAGPGRVEIVDDVTADQIADAVEASRSSGPPAASRRPV